MLILACQQAHCDNANLLIFSMFTGVSMLTFANYHLTKRTAEADRIVLSFSSIWPEIKVLGNTTCIHFPNFHYFCLSLNFCSSCCSLSLSLSPRSANGVVEKSSDRGVLSAGGFGVGGGVCALLQIQER